MTVTAFLGKLTLVMKVCVNMHIILFYFILLYFVLFYSLCELGLRWTVIFSSELVLKIDLPYIQSIRILY